MKKIILCWSDHRIFCETRPHSFGPSGLFFFTQNAHVCKIGSHYAISGIRSATGPLPSGLRAGESGAELAFEYYQQREALTVDHKGDDLQDVVSVADKRVEAFVKQRIQSAFPEDGFLGEERRRPPARRASAVGGRPHRWHQLFPQRPAHLVPVAGDRRRRRTGHRRGLRPQPSRAVSRPAGPWRPGSTTLRSVRTPRRRSKRA